MKSLLIIGAGGHGTVVKEVAKACGYDRIEFLDDTSPKALGKISEIDKFKEYENLFISIGNNKLRKKLFDIAKENGYKIPSLIHPDAYISESAVISEGTIVEPKAVINSNVIVGSGCIVSVGAIVDHDAIVEDYAHVNAGTVIKAATRLETYRKLEVGEVVYR